MSGQAKSETALREEGTLAFWKKNRIFEKSVEREAPNGEYVFYDGPPFATGLPHYGHIVASVIKDAVPRFWTMRGYSVPRVWGWDCHGLPIENIVEKELGFKHKKDIIGYGIDKFNETCRARVLTYAEEWEKIIPRIGRWADMEHAYRTMDKPFMESVWWVFKQVYDKGLVYEDYRSMHICPRCETTLSQQEVSEGYKDVKDISVTLKFELVDEPGTYFLAWTTTPWTLPGNVALAVNPKVTYVKAKTLEGMYWVAKERAATVVPNAEIVEEKKGSELVGKKYNPPFDYYSSDTSLKNRENGWKVYAADFITTDAGTGIAHEAPAFGADDWELSKRENLPFVQHVGMDGTMKPEVKDFAGMEVKPRSEDDKVRLGTAVELEEAGGKKIHAPHKHIVDTVTVPCECGAKMSRIPDVLDTWFDSGSMPYGEKHYPFENKERFEATFPAQFIAEGLDQTRAWFYYLHVLGGALFQKNTFQNVIVNGIVLAEDGKKMSKKLQNYPDPMEIVEKYGADALRLYLLSSPVMQAENLSFSESGVDEVAKKNISRLGHVLAFYKLYENETARDWKSTHILDQWILARLAALVGESADGYESYELDRATRPLALFIDDLSVWYVRRSRDRFKEEGGDKTAALATLRYVLHTLSKVLAPSMPFFAEHLFQAVREEEDEESVHLAMWPEVPGFSFDAADVLTKMFATRFIVSQALEAREQAKIKVRQPLQKLTVGSLQLAEEYVALIRDEVNVREVVVSGEVRGHVVLDTEVNAELREEGLVRDTIRAIQAFRKDSGLKPGEPATYKAQVPAGERAIIEKHRAKIEKATHTTVEFP